MKCNYERLERIRGSTQRVKILATTSKKLRMTTENKESEELQNIIQGELNPNSEEEKNDSDEEQTDADE